MERIVIFLAKRFCWENNLSSIIYHLSLFMKRVFIVHGWEASPESNWFPWLKTELEKKGIAAIVPAMPNSAHPDCEEWVGYLKKIVGQVDEDIFFVGHSLGPIAIMRFLESIPEGEKAGGIVMVSGFSESLGIQETETFFAKPLDYEKIKKSANKFEAINSDNDPYVPVDRGEMLRDRLGAKLTILHNYGHISADVGLTELPIVLEKILEISK